MYCSNIGSSSIFFLQPQLFNYVFELFPDGRRGKGWEQLWSPWEWRPVSSLLFCGPAQCVWGWGGWLTTEALEEVTSLGFQSLFWWTSQTIAQLLLHKELQAENKYGMNEVFLTGKGGIGDQRNLKGREGHLPLWPISFIAACFLSCSIVEGLPYLLSLVQSREIRAHLISAFRSFNSSKEKSDLIQPCQDTYPLNKLLTHGKLLD